MPDDYAPRPLLLAELDLRRQQACFQQGAEPRAVTPIGLQSPPVSF